MPDRPIRSTGELALRLAPATAALRDALLRLVRTRDPSGAAARAALAAWHASPDTHAGADTDASPAGLADGLAQVTACELVLAALTEATALGAPTPARPAPLAPDAPLGAALQAELAALDAVAAAVDRAALRRGADPRGEPWLTFYEDFLAVYDPAQRRRAGVWYTPLPVVRAMVRIVDHLLVTRLGRPRGFGDEAVSVVDPATGTGTFPLAVIDCAAERGAAAHLARHLTAFECLPGPHAVARLRVGERLRALGTLPPGAVPPGGEADGAAPPVRRADTLALPPPPIPADRVAVVLGNPPYRRVARRRAAAAHQAGAHPADAWLDPLLAAARAHTVFSHHASLYNRYVSFWRWALATAFEARPTGPGVVALVTASSWLTGPGFVGLRQLVRALGDEIWVLDLGGDSRAGAPETNVFAIGTPVAITVVLRAATSDHARPAAVHYRRLDGPAGARLAALETLAAAPQPLAGPWHAAPAGWGDPLVPPAHDAAWRALPALTDLFPWQQPGVMLNRTWPVAPDPDLLRRRWAAFVAAPPAERPALFVTPRTGRTAHSQVGALPPLAALPPDAPPPPVARYAVRSFDRQWTFADPRLAALDRPALWQARSPQQLFLVSLLTAPLGPGPALTVTTAVPDKHCFHGRGGKDVLPLWRDAAARAPNVTAGLLAALGAALGLRPPTPSPSPEDLAAAVYALLASPAYEARFRENLRTPGPRVPLPRDPALWAEAVALGRRLLWLHTFAERCRDPAEGRGEALPPVPGLGWGAPVRTLPATPAAVRYDAATGALHVGDGRVDGVPRAVWAYTVSGLPVVKRWLAYRTERGAGRAATSRNPLDRIRPTAWPAAWDRELLELLQVLAHTVALAPRQANLLARVCAGPLVTADLLPAPTAAERRVPATRPPRASGESASSARGDEPDPGEREEQPQGHPPGERLAPEQHPHERAEQR